MKRAIVNEVLTLVVKGRGSITGIYCFLDKIVLKSFRSTAFIHTQNAPEKLKRKIKHETSSERANHNTLKAIFSDTVLKLENKLAPQPFSSFIRLVRT